VAGFIGQESMHGQEHRRLNQKLIEMGYKIDLPDRPWFIERRIRFEQRLPARLHLAMTAAAEHYTAVLAEHILSSDEIQAIPGAPEVWHLLNWHALEELEHKSVAFDVYRAVGGSERMRIAVMATMITLSLPLGVLALTISLACDPFARRHPVRLVREAHRLFTGPMFDGLIRDLAKYPRPQFHPSDIDTAELLRRWQQELFGSEGTLVDHFR
jgi:predicted metal-dependent hydrolase